MKRLTLIITAAAALALLALPGAALAKSRDRNHDRLPDKWERHFHLSLSKDQAKADQDHDGLKNKGEFKNHTSPRDADTDNDGLEDGDEVRTANRPRDRDTNNDGVEDGEENAGRIASFDPATGTLVIDLGDNQTVTGHVTNATRIECRTAREQEVENENENENEVRSAEHGSDDGGGDDRSGSDSSGPGSGSSGSDNSGPGSTSSGPGDGDRNENEVENEQEDNCTTADLTQGTVVHEAELELENGQATFEKVELIK